MRSLDSLTGRSPAVTRVREQVHAVADSDASVLLTGESGTGKELVARHAARAVLAPRQALRGRQLRRGARRRSSRPSCSATSAAPSRAPSARREGRFAAAEAARCSSTRSARWRPRPQVKLLRVLQEQTYEPVGSTHADARDVRLVSATNRDLKELCAGGSLPPRPLLPDPRLRDRALAAARSAHGPSHAHRAVPARVLAGGRPPPGLTPAAWGALSHYGFPGNIRELKHSMQHATILARGADIDLAPPAARDQRRRSPRQRRARRRACGRR